MEVPASRMGRVAGRSLFSPTQRANARLLRISLRMCELRHTTLPRIDLTCRCFLPNWDPSPMAGSFLRSTDRKRGQPVSPVRWRQPANPGLTSGLLGVFLNCAKYLIFIGERRSVARLTPKETLGCSIEACARAVSQVQLGNRSAASDVAWRSGRAGIPEGYLLKIARTRQNQR